MAEEFGSEGFCFAFVYTREAHPSERFPSHENFRRKLEHARAMAERLQLKRPMLVDDLEGKVHHDYGRLPNMTYIVKPGGTIVYRASWTDPRTIRAALEQILLERAERRARRRMTPYYLEWQPQRPNDAIAFLEGLFELGTLPVTDYIAAVEHSEGEAAARPLKEWWARRRRADDR